LLASETGSGKSLAYLLPMLHNLKATDRLQPLSTSPRAIVLAPTHELSRQLAGFGKALVHHSRLRVQSTSRENIRGAGVSAAKMSASKMTNAFDGEDMEGEFEVRPGGKAYRGLDVLVGTPAKLLRMVRGRGWEKEPVGSEKVRQRKKRYMGRRDVKLSEVEWVIVDEADVLFGAHALYLCIASLFEDCGTDPDFIDQTLLLLSDIAAARKPPIPTISGDSGNRDQVPVPLDYPFNFILTSATIPAALASHLDDHHPTMTRLVSPQLHRLPTKLAVEFAQYKSGNRNAEVLAKLKAVWRDDALAGRRRARVVIFANTRTRTGEMGAYLSEHGVPNIVVTGQGIYGQVHKQGNDQRLHGSNKHLAGFLKPIQNHGMPSLSQPPSAEDENKTPRVLLSTSLLSRGLDFDPSVSHVFILGPPRNTADFLHRAGRTARAGMSGKVVVFGKGAGRGAGKVDEMRRKLTTLRGSARR
jgi:ATP-dependent RNA helicase MRH4